MPCPQCHTIYHTMPGHAIYHAMSARPWTLYHVMPARPYHAHQAIPYTMPARLYHKPCHASSGHTIYYAMPARTYHAIPRQAITFTMPCPPGQTIYLTMPARSYHISCHATANDYFGKSCHLSKCAKGLVTACTNACK